MADTKRGLGKAGQRAASLIDRLYKGQNVATYEASRRNNPKWSFEESGVKTVLDGLAPEEKTSVADIPVGTNRFYHLLDSDADIKIVYCVDYSEDMLTASMARSSGKFFYSKADMVNDGTPIVADTLVSVRFLNLFDFAIIEKIVANLCASTRLHFITSIRLASTDEEKDTIYEDKIHIHDPARFDACLTANGFETVWKEGRKDEKPGEYFILHARRTDQTSR